MHVACLITSALPDQGHDTVGDLLRTALKDILIFQVTSFTEELLTCPCQPISNIPPGIFPQILYTNRHACKEKAVNENTGQDVATKKKTRSRNEVEKVSAPWRSEVESSDISGK